MSPDVPAIVQKAADANAQSLRGVVVNERHITIRVSAGPMGHSEENDAKVLAVDGQFKRLHMLRITVSGKDLPPDQVAQREANDNRDLEKGVSIFKQPFDQHYLNDYSYEVQPAPADGQILVQFHSNVRDEQHGDGSMRIDSRNGRVENLSYTPNVMPKYASSGQVTETFGEPIPGLWAVVRIERNYRGHVAVFGARGNIVETDYHFERFATMQAGLNALEGQRLSPSP